MFEIINIFRIIAEDFKIKQNEFNSSTLVWNMKLIAKKNLKCFLCSPLFSKLTSNCPKMIMYLLRYT